MGKKSMKDYVSAGFTLCYYLLSLNVQVFIQFKAYLRCMDVYFFYSDVKNKKQCRQFKTKATRGFKDEVSKCYFQLQHGAHTNKNCEKTNRKPRGRDESLYFRNKFCSRTEGVFWSRDIQFPIFLAQLLFILSSHLLVVLFF